MNILQITKYYYPAMTFGGPVRCTYNLSSYLAKRGHNVTVYATDALYINNSTRIGIKQQIIGNVKVFYFPTLTRSYGFFVTPQMFAALQKNLGNFDIVHLHEYRTFQNLSYFFLNASKIPSVITLHGQLFTAYVGDHVDSIALRTAFDSLLGRRMLNRSKRVLALTESEAKKCIKLGVHSNKVIVVPNGVDPDDFSNLLPKGEFKKQFHIVNEKMILYVGRINRRKGIDVLIKACSKLFNHKRDTTLVIAGADDGFLTEARLMVKCLGLESSVIFTGGLTRKQILAAYNDASIVVYAGIQEGFPLVPLEAGIMGKPIIVSDDPANDFFKKGRFAISVKYGNANELCDAIDYVLSNSEIARELGANGKDFVLNNCSWNIVGQQVESIYNSVLSEKTSI
jgi:glycosyltransferase involved in cell wall biosynthesis